jgi:hypothetical protein
VNNVKKIVILISIIFVFMNVVQAEIIDECRTDMYFGNGVWNEPEDVEDSVKKLKEKIITPYIVKNDPKLKIKYGEVKLAYNWGQGTMTDLLETFYQLKQAGQVTDKQFYKVISILTRKNKMLTLSAIAAQKLMESFIKNWEPGNVNEMLYKFNTESFKPSHKVLLISHSQGNLFANRVYDTISPTGYQNYFANLQVASPASIVKAQKGDYVTLSTDFLKFDPVINGIPGSMLPNASGDSGHEFVSAYLSQTDPLTKIVTKTKQLLTRLDSEPSQWQTDQELRQGTIDQRITVKHRFDSSVLMNSEVYPFAPNMNLYQVNGEWVKASCGGENILSTWSGQKNNEFYLIDNFEKEIIVGDNVDDVHDDSACAGGWRTILFYFSNGIAVHGSSGSLMRDTYLVFPGPNYNLEYLGSNCSLIPDKYMSLYIPNNGFYPASTIITLSNIP